MWKKEFSRREIERWVAVNSAYLEFRRDIGLSPEIAAAETVAKKRLERLVQEQKHFVLRESAITCIYASVLAQAELAARFFEVARSGHGLSENDVADVVFAALGETSSTLEIDSASEARVVKGYLDCVSVLRRTVLGLGADEEARCSDLTEKLAAYEWGPS